ncbi:hypothetical protein [Planomicrobium okeanokoites]|uniref:Phage abortive infection protein n=1 Tax=Planomicrobium okeanokoites TaxID=244 RepID=A0ABV7KL79_PLAOK|nr:hypothetical protein [Planomicrobium okeanokoites]TAA69383.1 hypothetical protein D2910_08570 [Planomicrobium okeanokoites]
MQNFKRLISFKEHIIIWTFVLVLSIIMIYIQHTVGELGKTFWLSLIPSVIIDSLFILIASYFIAYFLRKSEKRRAKNQVYKMLGNRYEKMILNLAKDYITFITKKPVVTKNSIDNIEDVKEQIHELSINMQNYISSNFYKENVKVFFFDDQIKTNSISEMFQEKQWTVHRYIQYLKSTHLKNMDLFITKYISVIPEDLREILFRVEDTLQGNYFVTELDYAPKIDISIFYLNVEEFSEVFKELSKDIYYLLTYFEGIQENDTSKNFRGGLFHHSNSQILLFLILFPMLFYVLIKIGLLSR